MTLRLPRTVLFAAFVACLHGTVVGQNYYYAPSDTPTVGTCNVFPWGQSSARQQHVVTAAELGNATQTITEIAYAACGTGTFSASQIVIQMAHYQGTTLSATFASNLGANPVTVLNATNWTYPYTQNAWSDVGLTNAFQYDPAQGNLLIDIEFCGAAGGTSFHRDVAPRCYANGGPCPSNPTGTPSNSALKVRIGAGTGGTYATFGQGCGSPTLTLAGSGVPNIGGMSSVAMSNGPVGSIGAFGVGFAPTNVPLGSGAPGCNLYVSPLAVVITVFDNVGNSTSLDIVLPNDPGLIGLHLVHAGAALDPAANAQGVTTSNGLTATVGF